MPGCGRAIANGGRYDDIGSEFGRARPATGFSIDLRALASQAAGEETEPEIISAPFEEDDSLINAVRALRKSGKRVVYYDKREISDTEEEPSNRLVNQNGEWVIQR